MFDQYAQQLTSPDAATRRQAIIALGNSGDQRALPLLSNVYKTDSDPTLRELALKAGRYIKGLTATSPGPNLPGTGPLANRPKPVSKPVNALVPAHSEPSPFLPVKTPAFKEEQTPPFKEEDLLPAPSPDMIPVGPQPTVKEVSDYHKRMAQGKLDSAIGLVSRGENDKGLSELIAAIRYDPAVAKNSIAMNLATNVTGIASPDDAMQEVLIRVDEHLASGADQPLKISSILADPDLLEMLLMLVLLFIVMCGVGFWGKSVASQLLALVSKPSAKTPDPAVMALLAITPAEIFQRGAGYAVAAFLNAACLYAVGIGLGGSGTVFRFIKALLRVFVVEYVVIAAGLALMDRGLIGAPTLRALLSNGLFLLGGIAIVIGFLGGLIWQYSAVSHQHEVGFWKGVLIVLAGGVVGGFVGISVH